METTSKEEKKEDGKLVVYDKFKGGAYLLDPATKELTPIELKDGYGLSGVDELKTSKGYYRKEVLEECKRLYFSNYTPREIEEKTGVKLTVIHNRINRTDYAEKPWAVQKKEHYEALNKANQDKYISVERVALERLQEFLESKRSHISDAKEFKEFSEGLSKVLGRGIGQGSKPTNINIMNNITPLTPEEARKVLENDPIRVIETTATDESEPGNTLG